MSETTGRHKLQRVAALFLLLAVLNASALWGWTGGLLVVALAAYHWLIVVLYADGSWRKR